MNLSIIVLMAVAVVASGSPSPQAAAKELVKRDVGENLSDFQEAIVTALREVGPSVQGNNTQLDAILEELKSINDVLTRQFKTSNCQPPFFQLGDECFLVNLEDLSWEEARASCIAAGADLASPNNLQELKAYVGEKYPRKKQRNFWLGGVYNNKLWKWLSGEKVGSTNWHTNEPSGNGDCLGLFDGWENPLTDFPCENERRSICERNLD